MQSTVASLLCHGTSKHLILIFCSAEKKAVFLKLLDDVIGEEKGTVTLKCEASKPTVSPIWRKDGTILSADRKHELLHDGRILGLTIRDVMQTDAGEYSCDLGTDLTKSKVTIRGMMKGQVALDGLYLMTLRLLYVNDRIKHLSIFGAQ